MRFQASACLLGLTCLCPNEQRQRENQIRLGQIAGMPHPPALQRAVMQDLEFEPCVGEEYPEAEIHGGKVREKLDLVRFAWRWLGGGGEQVMRELVRKRRDEAVGPLQQGRA